MLLWPRQSFITIANPVKFAFLYSFGNLVSLLATMFLMGPCKQFKNMFDEKRRTASIVYLVALAATLTVAIWVRRRLCAQEIFRGLYVSRCLSPMGTSPGNPTDVAAACWLLAIAVSKVDASACFCVAV